MGSLLPGWDQMHGKPKGMEDFEEPSKLPRPVHGPPSLGRFSCPPALHSIHASQPGSPSNTADLSRKPGLGRSSMSHPSSPRPGSRGSGEGPFSRMFSFAHEGQEAGGQKAADVMHIKEKWYQRMDSDALNKRPDDPADLNAFRSGTFKPDDPQHSMQVMHAGEAPSEAETTPTTALP